MNKGDPKKPKFKVGDVVHASPVALSRPDPFRTGLSLRPDTAFRIEKIDEAITDKEDHVYHVEPIDADKIEFSVKEEQMLKTMSFTRGQQIWHEAETGRVIVTFLEHTVKRRDQTYTSLVLKQSRMGKPGEADMVARIKYKDCLMNQDKEDDADKFSYATAEELQSAWNFI